MAGLAFLGKSSYHREIAETDAFIEAINEGSLMMRIRDKEPKNLDQALHIALLAEANTDDRNNAEPVESPVKSKEFKLRSVRNKEQINDEVVAGDKDKAYNNESIEERCKKMCDVMETFLSKCAIATNTTSPPVTPQYAWPPSTCYNCGVQSHLSNRCPTKVDKKDGTGTLTDAKRAPTKCYGCGDFGHLVRNCTIKDKGTPKVTNDSVRGVKGLEMRSMQEHPVYLTATIGRREMNFLVDTGSDKCVIPKRLVDGARMQPAGCRLFAANEAVINVMGEITLDVCLEDLTLPTKEREIFLRHASDIVTEPMLGNNWLRMYQATWDFAKGELAIEGETFELIRGDGNNRCRRVVAGKK